MIRENQILLIFDYFSSFILYWNYIFKREVRYYVELPFWVTLVFPSFQNVFVQTLLIGSVYEVDCMLSLSIYLITLFFLKYIYYFVQLCYVIRWLDERWWK